MSPGARWVSVGRVGKPHGLDGSFYVVGASHPLPEGMSVTVAGQQALIERRAGTAEKPLLRIAGVSDREQAARLAGESVLVDVADAPLESDEWLTDDLLGCEVVGVGKVTRVVEAPSCDLLEAGPDGDLIPFISDAIKHIDLAKKRIEVDRRFLGLDDPGGRR